MRLLIQSLAIGVLILSGCASAPELQVEPSPIPELQDETSRAYRGRDYAEVSCAACHAVQPGETVSPWPIAPAFQTVADTPGMTSIALNAWLHTPHPNMPNFVIPEEHVDELLAYFDVLRTD